MQQAFGAKIDAIRATVNDALQDVAAAWDEEHSTTARAMRYSLLGPGKRLRASVTVLVAQCFGSDLRETLAPACAIEMAHAASLILDDLPCMDDARMRRNKPTSHVAFGEDIALLAAFGLLNEAYGLVGGAPDIPSERRVRLVAAITGAVGLRGLIGGQEQDLRSGMGSGAHHAVDDIHSRKTAVLFVAAAEAGAIVAGATDEQTGRVAEFAARLGMAFQTFDDFVDTLATTSCAGKDTGQDALRANMVTLVGRDRALKGLLRQVQRANDAIEPFGESAAPLGHLAQSLIDGAFQLTDTARTRP